MSVPSIARRAAAALSLFLLSAGAMAQISLTGPTYTQDFDTLPVTGTGTTPSGWEFLETGTAANSALTANNGAVATLDTYSYGSTSASDRALGTLTGGTLTPVLIGSCFRNLTGSNITSLAISYTGEQWRKSNGTGDILSFQYNVSGNLGINAAGLWSNHAALNFTPPEDGGNGAKDGNATANRVAISSSISSLAITHNSNFCIRWSDVDVTSNDDGIAIDDFSITTTSALTPQSITFNNPGSQAFGTSPTLVATATSGLAVSFSSDSPGNCTITTGGVLTTVSIGSCTIRANQSGDSTYGIALPVVESFLITQGSQTITFTSAAPAAATVGGATYTPTATGGGSGNPVAFTIDASASSVCSISAGTVSFIGAGTCVINANQNGDINYVVAPQVQQSFAVTLAGQASQSITFNNPGSQMFGTSPTITAIADSGLTVSFSSTTMAVCTITTGGTLTFLSTGSCSIDADQAGDANYLPAFTVSRTFSVVPGLQTIDFPQPADQVFGTTPTLTASASSGLAVTFTTGSASCNITVTGTLSFDPGALGCSVTVSQDGNVNYVPASSVIRSFSVTQASQSITFPNPGTQTFGASPTLTASATSGLAVAYNTATPSVCTPIGNTVVFNSTGTCVLHADQAGNLNYFAAPQASVSFAIDPASQTISFTSMAPSGATVGGATYTPTATATSGLTVSFTIDASSSSVCTISSGTVSFIDAGTCTINANQAGDSNYAAALQVQQSFTVVAVNDPPVITSTAPTTATEDVLYTYAATRADVDGPGQAWTLTGAHTCGGSIVSGSGVFTFTPAGPTPPVSCVVAVQVCDGGSPNLCATQSTTVTITAVNDPPVINTTASTTATEDTLYTYNATRIDADGPGQAWTLTGAHTCGGSIVSGTGVFTFTPVGPTPPASCTVAVQVCDGGSPNLCATQTTSVTITADNDAPVITSTASTTATEDVLYTYAATIGTSDGPSVNWSLSGGHTCGGSIVSGSGVFTFTPAGPTPPASCTVAVQVCDGASPNLCATQTTSVTITAVNDPPVINSTAPTTATEDVLYTYNATRIDGDGPGQAWTLTGAHTCGGSIVSGTGVFTFTPVGPTPPASCVVAVQVCDGASPNLCATQSTTVTIIPVNDPPVINTTAPTTATEDVLYTYDADATDGDGPGQAWTLTGAHTCGGSIVSGSGVFTFTPAGPTPPASCVVAVQVCDGASPNLCATQSTMVTITDVPEPQVITFANPGSQVFGTSPTLTASGGGSGNAVTFSSTTSGVCTITSGGLLTTVSAGTCSIDANQAGDAVYSAAPTVTQSFSITQASQTISFTSSAPGAAAVGGATYTPTATATSGLAVTLSIDVSSSAVCSISSGTVSFIGAGTCTINANQAGNANYFAAPQVQQSFTVATVPGAPIIGIAAAGDAQATASFNPPGSNGGSAITGYTATAYIGGVSTGLTGSCATAPCLVTGLTNGTTYTFRIYATNAIGNSPLSPPSNPVTPNTPAALLPTLSVTDETTKEGNTGTMKQLVFRVKLSKLASTPVTVNITTVNGSATAPSDYTANSVTGLTIPTGVLAATFTVKVNGDTSAEPDETMTAVISSAVGATIVDNTGIGTITNDDGGARVLAYVPLVTQAGMTTALLAGHLGEAADLLCATAGPAIAVLPAMDVEASEALADTLALREGCAPYDLLRAEGSSTLWLVDANQATASVRMANGASWLEAKPIDAQSQGLTMMNPEASDRERTRELKRWLLQHPEQALVVMGLLDATERASLRKLGLSELGELGENASPQAARALVNRVLGDSGRARLLRGEAEANAATTAPDEDQPMLLIIDP